MEYFIQRFSRLWTVIIPALFFTFIIDVLFYDGQISLLSSSINSFPTLDYYQRSISTFFGNVFFLQTIYFPTFGSNGPLWSLANEFWYYVLFPLIFFSFHTKYIRSLRILFFLFFIIISLWLPFKITMLFPLWLIGVLTYVIYDKYSFKLASLITSIAIFFLVITITRFKLVDGLLSDYIIGLSFSFLILVLKTDNENFSLNSIKHLIKFLSRISFTLYLFHFPIIVLIVKILNGEKLITDLNGYMLYTIFAILCVISGWLLWLPFERNTPRVRFFLFYIFMRKHKNAFLQRHK